MRPVLSLALAAAAAITILGCGETEEVLRSDTTTPSSTASEAATDTATPDSTAEASPTEAAEATEHATPDSRTLAPTPTASVTLSAYEEPEYGVTLRYPTGWTVSSKPVTEDQAQLDVLKNVEFMAKDGLPRIRLFIGANPSGLSLRDWLEKRNPIFLDTDPQEVTVDGIPGLFQPTSLGLPRPQVYLAVDSLVVSVAGLTEDDYEFAINHLDIEEVP